MQAHEVLGIPADASEERVRAAFKVLVGFFLFTSLSLIDSSRFSFVLGS